MYPHEILKFKIKILVASDLVHFEAQLKREITCQQIYIVKVHVF